MVWVRVLYLFVIYGFMGIFMGFIGIGTFFGFGFVCLGIEVDFFNIIICLKEKMLI